MRKFLVLFIALLAALVLAVSPAAAQEPTIAEIVVAQAGGSPAEFTILLAAVQAADPSILQALSNPSAELTVFAPTDAAFRRLFRQLGVTPQQVLNNQALLNQILLYHVLPHEYNSAQLFDLSRLGWPNDYLRTLQGTFVEFTDDNGSLIVDGSWVQAADIQASNGIIHVIARVLQPSFNFGEQGVRSNPVKLRSSLSGANEVAPVVGDPDGTGASTVILDTARGLVCWQITVSNIDTIRAAHIHRGVAGINGPVVIDFNGKLSGCVRADRALVQDVANNPAGYYVNVHTISHPGGAVRGQLGA